MYMFIKQQVPEINESDTEPKETEVNALKTSSLEEIDPMLNFQKSLQWLIKRKEK